MHDLPSVTLLQQQHAVPKTGEELEVLGKCAAKKYAGGELETLNEAVVETVKHAGLSPEQVRRVIEFANTNAYLTEFNKEGSSHKYIEFHGGPADPAEILRDLNDGGGGTVFDRGLADYALAPPQVKTSEVMERNLAVVHDALSAKAELEKVAARTRVGGPTMMDIAGDMQGDVMKSYSLPGYGSQGFDPFGERQKMMQVKMLSAMTGKQPVVVKHGSALDFNPEETMLREAFAAEDEPYPYANPEADSVELRDKLAGAAEHLTTEVFGLEVQFQDRLNDVYQQVKQAALEGVELGQILAAWQQVIPDATYVKTAFAYIGPRLVQDEVFSTVDDVGSSLEKTAHQGFVNPKHPLVGSMASYCMVLDKLAEVHAAQEELVAHRDELDGFLQKVAILQKLKASGGLVPKVTKAFRTAGEGAGKGATELGEALFGAGSKGAKRMATVAQKGVQYMPHAVVGGAGLLGAKELSDRMRYSPTYQQIKNYAMSHVPYSHQGQMRRQQLQMGAY
jgi:hypothetical protein